MIALDKQQTYFSDVAIDRETLPAWPLPPEAHIPTWQQYLAESQEKGVWPTLQTRLVQLQFPIQAGVSRSPVYRAVTRQGVEIPNIPPKTGLVLQKPDALCLFIHHSIAGPIPVLKTETHADFAALVQAILKKNEPVPIPQSAGAYIVSGYNNWDRIRAYRRQWTAENPNNCSQAEWQAEFKHLIPQKHLYQDRFIILHDGPYSGVPATKMGLEEAEWRKLSMKIRLEHECTHYFTKRVFGLMRQHVFDELLADYVGIVAALGHYRADWFLRFMGLEAYPVYREGGRLQNYLDGMAYPSSAFQTVQTLLKAAAENLERFDRWLGSEQAYRQPAGQALVLLAICRFSLTELAATTAPRLLFETLQTLGDQISLKSRAGG